MGDCQAAAMICLPKLTGLSRRKHPVTEILEEIAAQQVTVELVGPEEEALWNKLIRKHHYLKEHRMVGEGGWSHDAFVATRSPHRPPRRIASAPIALHSGACLWHSNPSEYHL